ncbi:MAG: sulfotransferase domain-containing protein [Actinomycetota bacterium]
MERTPIIRPHITPFEDSRRWEHVSYRPGDIVIATPPKCGTTWTQRIVMSLLWPDDDTPGGRGELSPWVDVRVLPIEELAERLAGQQHRRFIKTHSPADAIPLDPDVRYVVVYRGAADALVSWGNHRATMRSEAVEMLNSRAAPDGIEGVPLTFHGDYNELLVEWTAYWSPAIHLAPWWPLRHEPNVHLMHYRDMDADLSAEMARLAGFLDIDVPAERWHDTVERCRLDAMRTEAQNAGFNTMLFSGGAESFYYKGGVGRGRQLLTEAQLDAVADHVAARLPADAQAWLESGGPVP